jgi:hypothetical protein
VWPVLGRHPSFSEARPIPVGHYFWIPWTHFDLHFQEEDAWEPTEYHRKQVFIVEAEWVQPKCHCLPVRAMSSPGEEGLWPGSVFLLIQARDHFCYSGSGEWLVSVTNQRWRDCLSNCPIRSIFRRNWVQCKAPLYSESYTCWCASPQVAGPHGSLIFKVCISRGNHARTPLKQKWWLDFLSWEPTQTSHGQVLLMVQL